jgi:hypothetical protein
MRTGGCLCGAVRYRIDGPDPAIDICHCSMCRKNGGHAQAGMTVRREDFRFTDDGGLAWYASSEHGRRGFCRICGSALLFDALGDPFIYPNAGSLDDASGLRVRSHIHTASKGAYYEITDGLPQFPAERDED